MLLNIAQEALAASNEHQQKNTFKDGGLRQMESEANELFFKTLDSTSDSKCTQLQWIHPGKDCFG